LFEVLQQSRTTLNRWRTNFSWKSTGYIFGSSCLARSLFVYGLIAEVSKVAPP